MTTNSILPQNSTPLELALEIAMRPSDEAIAGVELVRTAKESPPDSWLMWLVWEYGLHELLPYLPNPRDAIEKGIEWQRIRGTPASLTLAFSWLDLDASIIQETATGVHWFEYQLDSGTVPSPLDLRNLCGLARLSAPVGTRLSRVFHEYDYRHGLYDHAKWSDGSLYSAESGVWDDENGVIVSFGRTHQTTIQWNDETITDNAIRYHVSSLVRDNTALYGVTRYDELVQIVYPFEQYSEHMSIISGAGRNLRVADGIEFAGIATIANGGERIEQPQYPAYHNSEEASLGWGDHTWDDNTWA